MFNNKTIYTLNKKDCDAIVYTDAEGKTLRLTYKDFASKEEFDRWKEWSDKQYHQWEKEDHLYANHTISLSNFANSTISTPDLEVLMEQSENAIEHMHKRNALVQTIQTILTEMQFRRLWMYHAEGRSQEEIAVLEGSTQQRISKSLLLAKGKIKKYFSD